MILSSNTNYDEDDLGDAYADESVIDQTHPVRRSKRRGKVESSVQQRILDTHAV